MIESSIIIITAVSADMFGGVAVEALLVIEIRFAFIAEPENAIIQEILLGKAITTILAHPLRGLFIETHFAVFTRGAEHPFL